MTPGPGFAGGRLQGAPWRRARRGHHPDWPPGAVIVAGVFHIAGARELADRGEFLLALTPPVYALLLIGPVALFWRRRLPVVAFAVAAVASLAVATRAGPYWMSAVAPALALFTLARQGRRIAAGVAALLGWVAYLLVTVGLAGPLGLPDVTRPGLRESLLAGVGLAASVLAGTVSKIRHDQMAALAQAQKETQRAVEEQKRAEAEQRRRQASEERLRMAQELHDVLGHHLSLISVQAGVGLHLMDNRPEQAREALSAIKTASAEALREVRSVLGVLRTEGEAAPRQPALGLSRLTELTAGAGFPVHTRIDGRPRDLPAEVDRAAYRIVQEALTNVRRHAGPEPDVLVEIGYRADALHLSISNTGPAGGTGSFDDTRSPGAGGSLGGGGSLGVGGSHGGGGSVGVGGSRGGADPAAGIGRGESTIQQGSGITGMRARAESLGGRFTAGPGPGGGFRVTATLPSLPVTGAEPATAERSTAERSTAQRSTAQRTSAARTSAEGMSAERASAEGMSAERSSAAGPAPVAREVEGTR